MCKFSNFSPFLLMSLCLLCAKVDANPKVAKQVTSQWPGIVRGNAIWVWDSTKTLLRDSKERSRFYNFCANPPGGADPVRIVYLYAGWPNFLTTFSDPLHQFIKGIHAHRMKVHYLDGIPQWALESQRELALASIDEIILFNSLGKASEHFDGIQFDVEPYLLKEWGDPMVVQSYKEHLIECTEKIHKANLPFGVAIPYFHDERGDDLLEEIIKTVDYISIMNYKDNAKMMIPNVKTEMEMAVKYKKPIWIGVETQGPSKKFGVTPRETFFDEGYIKMETELKLFRSEFQDHHFLYGIAYHHYSSYLSMLPGSSDRDQDNQISIACPKKDFQVTIDGQLSEWLDHPKIEITDRKNVVYSISENAWEGPNDLSATIYLAWDEEGLYLSGKINDDVIFQQSSGSDIWKGDHIEIWLDTEVNYNPDRTVHNEFTYQIGISPGNFNGQQPEIFLWKPEEKISNLSSINWSTKKDPVGYTFELLLPWKFLQISIPSSSFSFRLNVDPSDTDSQGIEQKALMSMSPTRIFSDPTTFRTIKLVD